MKLTVLKDILKEALVVAERMVARSPSLPILTNILLSARNNTLELTATDLEVGIRYTVLSKNETEGQVVVPATHLTQLIGLLEESNITLETQGNVLRVKTKNSTTKLKTLPPQDFPIVPALKEKRGSVKIEAVPFCQGMAQVVGMTGQSQARPEISGVLMALGKRTLKLVATDSFRLAEKTLNFGEEQEREGNFIIPQKTAQALVAVLGEKPGAVNIYLTPSQAIFDWEAPDDPSQPHIQMVSRLIEGEYPNYQEIIPSEYRVKAIVGKGELLNQIRTASIFAGKTGEAHLTLDPQKRGIEVGAVSPDVGEHRSLLRADVTGERSEASFNWRFIADGLLQIRGGEVELGISSEEGPATIKPIPEEGYLYVVMPVRT